MIATSEPEVTNAQTVKKSIQTLYV